MARSYGQVCPIARTLDVIGDRWALLILRDLFFERSRFKELLAHSPGMPTKILSDRLKSFEAAGIVERNIYSVHPLRAEYVLTERGRSLAPVMEAMLVWGLEHIIDENERGELMDRIRADVAAVPGGAAAMGWQAEWINQRTVSRASRGRVKPRRKQ